MITMPREPILFHRNLTWLQIVQSKVVEQTMPLQAAGGENCIFNTLYSEIRQRKPNPKTLQGTIVSRKRSGLEPNGIVSNIYCRESRQHNSQAIAFLYFSQCISPLFSLTQFFLKQNAGLLPCWSSRTTAMQIFRCVVTNTIVSPGKEE